MNNEGGHKSSFLKYLVSLSSFTLSDLANCGKINALDYKTKCLDRGVAQPGSALGSGPRGRRFESSHPDYYNYKIELYELFF